MIYDYLDREISLDQIVGEELKYPIAKTQQKWDKFHLDYILGVGDIVGFNRPNQKKKKLTKPERKAFTTIFKEYHDQPVLQELFGSYQNFFNCFFVKPYGIEFVNGEYINLLSSMKESLEDIRAEHKLEDDKQRKRELEGKINQLKEEISIINFVRGINLPFLFYDSLISSKKKSPQHKFPRDLDVSYLIDSGKIVETKLKPVFASDLWDYVFASGTDDCIFVALNRDSEGTLNAKFQKYWFASMLHALNPAINYLNFRTPSRDIPSPLYRVKLMETRDKINDLHLNTEDKKKTKSTNKRKLRKNKNSGKYLVVGGVLGDSFEKIKSKGVMEFIDNSIRDFFTNRYSKKDRLFYNFNHVSDEKKPYNKFVKWIKNRYSISDKKIKSIGKIKGKKVTHHLIIPLNQHLVSRISNLNEDGENLFRGEQYSETFEPNQDKVALGAFVTLDGMVNGFDMSYGKVKGSVGRKIAYSMLGFLGLGLGLIAVSTFLVYGAVLLDQKENIRQYNISQVDLVLSGAGLKTRITDEVRSVVVNRELPTHGINIDPNIPKKKVIPYIFERLMYDLKDICDDVKVGFDYCFCYNSAHRDLWNETDFMEANCYCSFN